MLLTEKQHKYICMYVCVRAWECLNTKHNITKKILATKLINFATTTTPKKLHIITFTKKKTTTTTTLHLIKCSKKHAFEN